MAKGKSCTVHPRRIIRDCTETFGEAAPVTETNFSLYLCFGRFDRLAHASHRLPHATGGEGTHGLDLGCTRKDARYTFASPSERSHDGCTRAASEGRPLNSIRSRTPQDRPADRARSFWHDCTKPFGRSGHRDRFWPSPAQRLGSSHRQPLRNGGKARTPVSAWKNTVPLGWSASDSG